MASIAKRNKRGHVVIEIREGWPPQGKSRWVRNEFWEPSRAPAFGRFLEWVPLRYARWK